LEEKIGEEAQMANSVSLNTVFTSFQRADKDKSGTLSKKEIAQEALRLKTEGKTDEFSLFATFLQGGSDCGGLFPDFFNATGKSGTDGYVSLADLAELAKADSAQDGGSADTISSKDFQAKFGNRAGSGNAIDIDKLKETAGQGPSGSSGDIKKILLVFMLMTFCGGAQGGQQGGGMMPLLLGLLGGQGDDEGSNPLAGLLGSLGGSSSASSSNPLSSLFGSLLGGGSSSGGLDISSLFAGLLGE
jgi:hypothetical protein